MTTHAKSAKGISQQTLCRHGFHEWVECESKHHASRGLDMKLIRCIHCGEPRKPLVKVSDSGACNADMPDKENRGVTEPMC